MKSSIIILTLSLLSVTLLPCTIAAPEPYHYLELTETGDFEDRMVSFNCNFEKESLNEAPRIGFMSTDQKNLSINIVQFPGYNQVLRMAKNGTLTNFPKLTLYTGNGYSSGIVDFEFDVNIEEMSSTAHGVQMNYGASGGSTSEHTIQFLKKK